MSFVLHADARLPRAVLLDLDDTIVDDSRIISSCWRDACFAHASELEGLDASAVLEEIERTRAWYWADPVRHRTGRLRLSYSRRVLVRMSLSNLGLDRPDVADAIAGHYQAARERGLESIGGSVETVHWLRARGCRLALLTNGEGQAQRVKIDRFQLGPLFDHIFIEGELGFGKPDPRVYDLALDTLEVAPEDTWMVGDNLEWDVAAPQRLGITGIWIDGKGRGLPADPPSHPSRIIRRLSDLMDGPTRKERD